MRVVFISSGWPEYTLLLANALSELVEVGLDQLLPPEDGVTIVEWPDRIDGIVDISDILVRIEQLEGSSRKIQIT